MYSFSGNGNGLIYQIRNERATSNRKASYTVIKLAYSITETEHIRPALNKFNECNVNNVMFLSYVTKL